MSLDDRKKLVRQHIDLTWNRGHLALAEHLHSKDFLYKSSFIGRPLGSVEFLDMVRQIRQAMPELEVVVEECLAEGNRVVTWSTLIGTIAQPAFGYPPSDKVLSISAMAFWTITPTQQVQEICTMFDMESFRAQLGLETRPFAEKALP
ncbi:ester cyclase [Stutzerimonas sp. R40042]|uniref:ketosteroid isomerase-related protein n=1 Tax=Stutzerimonas TaxID=2901164 RepID=UPI00224CCFCE|nr:ketosteroid isomerase-related protein [Stutzerimonas sp. R40042]MCX4197679.1 ester cyclase [Methylobacterium organophilum]WAE62446.1 ester cyclase [Stutzerimonas sp. R40042]